MVDWFESTFGHKMTYPVNWVKASAGIAEVLFSSSYKSGKYSPDGISAAFAAVANSMSI